MPPLSGLAKRRYWKNGGEESHYILPIKNLFVTWKLAAVLVGGGVKGGGGRGVVSRGAVFGGNVRQVANIQVCKSIIVQ